MYKSIIQKAYYLSEFLTKEEIAMVNGYITDLVEMGEIAEEQVPAFIQYVDSRYFWWALFHYSDWEEAAENFQENY